MIKGRRIVNESPVHRTFGLIGLSVLILSGDVVVYL